MSKDDLDPTNEIIKNTSINEDDRKSVTSNSHKENKKKESFNQDTIKKEEIKETEETIKTTEIDSNDSLKENEKNLIDKDYVIEDNTENIENNINKEETNEISLDENKENFIDDNEPGHEVLIENQESKEINANIIINTDEASNNQKQDNINKNNLEEADPAVNINYIKEVEDNENSKELKNEDKEEIMPTENDIQNEKQFDIIFNKAQDITNKTSSISAQEKNQFLNHQIPSFFLQNVNNYNNKCRMDNIYYIRNFFLFQESYILLRKNHISEMNKEEYLLFLTICDISLPLYCNMQHYNNFPMMFLEKRIKEFFVKNNIEFPKNNDIDKLELYDSDQYLLYLKSTSNYNPFFVYHMSFLKNINLIETLINLLNDENMDFELFIRTIVCVYKLLFHYEKIEEKLILQLTSNILNYIEKVVLVNKDYKQETFYKFDHPLKFEIINEKPKESFSKTHLESLQRTLITICLVLFKHIDMTDFKEYFISKYNNPSKNALLLKNDYNDNKFITEDGEENTGVFPVRRDKRIKILIEYFDFQNKMIYLLLNSNSLEKRNVAILLLNDQINFITTSDKMQEQVNSMDKDNWNKDNLVHLDLKKDINNYLKSFLCHWLLEVKIFEMIFGEKIHEAIIIKSGFCLNFMYKNNLLEFSNISKIWKFAQEKHESISSSILNLLSEIVSFLSIDHCMYILKEISELNLKDINFATLKILESFSNNQNLSKKEIKIVNNENKTNLDTLIRDSSNFSNNFPILEINPELESGPKKNNNNDEEEEILFYESSANVHFKDFYLKLLWKLVNEKNFTKGLNQQIVIKSRNIFSNILMKPIFKHELAKYIKKLISCVSSNYLINTNLSILELILKNIKNKPSSQIRDIFEMNYHNIEGLVTSLDSNYSLLPNLFNSIICLKSEVIGLTEELIKVVSEAKDKGESIKENSNINNESTNILSDLNTSNHNFNSLVNIEDDINQILNNYDYHYIKTNQNSTFLSSIKNLNNNMLFKNNDNDGIKEINNSNNINTKEENINQLSNDHNNNVHVDFNIPNNIMNNINNNFNNELEENEENKQELDETVSTEKSIKKSISTISTEITKDEKHKIEIIKQFYDTFINKSNSTIKSSVYKLPDSLLDNFEFVFKHLKLNFLGENYFQVLEQILEFIKFVLFNSNIILKQSYIEFLYTLLLQNSVNEEEQNLFFSFFTSIVKHQQLSGKIILNDDTLSYLLFNIILKLDLRNLSISGFNLFQTIFFIFNSIYGSVVIFNNRITKIYDCTKILGLESLWRIFLESNNKSVQLETQNLLINIISVLLKQFYERGERNDNFEDNNNNDNYDIDAFDHNIKYIFDELENRKRFLEEIDNNELSFLIEEIVKHNLNESTGVTSTLKKDEKNIKKNPNKSYFSLFSNSKSQYLKNYQINSVDMTILKQPFIHINEFKKAYVTTLIKNKNKSDSSDLTLNSKYILDDTTYLYAEHVRESLQKINRLINLLSIIHFQKQPLEKLIESELITVNLNSFFQNNEGKKYFIQLSIDSSVQELRKQIAIKLITELKLSELTTVELLETNLFLQYKGKALNNPKQTLKDLKYEAGSFIVINEGSHKKTEEPSPTILKQRISQIKEMFGYEDALIKKALGRNSYKVEDTIIWLTDDMNIASVQSELDQEAITGLSVENNININNDNIESSSHKNYKIFTEDRIELLKSLLGLNISLIDTTIWRLLSIISYSENAINKAIDVNLFSQLKLKESEDKANYVDMLFNLKLINSLVFGDNFFSNIKKLDEIKRTEWKVSFLVSDGVELLINNVEKIVDKLDFYIGENSNKNDRIPKATVKDMINKKEDNENNEYYDDEISLKHSSKDTRKLSTDKDLSLKEDKDEKNKTSNQDTNINEIINTPIPCNTNIDKTKDKEENTKQTTVNKRTNCSKLNLFLEILQITTKWLHFFTFSSAISLSQTKDFLNNVIKILLQNRPSGIIYSLTNNMSNTTSKHSTPSQRTPTFGSPHTSFDIETKSQKNIKTNIFSHVANIVGADEYDTYEEEICNSFFVKLIHHNFYYSILKFIELANYNIIKLVDLNLESVFFLLLEVHAILNEMDPESFKNFMLKELNSNLLMDHLFNNNTSKQIRKIIENVFIIMAQSKAHECSKSENIFFNLNLETNSSNEDRLNKGKENTTNKISKLSSSNSLGSFGNKENKEIKEDNSISNNKKKIKSSKEALLIHICRNYNKVISSLQYSNLIVCSEERVTAFNCKYTQKSNKDDTVKVVTEEYFNLYSYLLQNSNDIRKEILDELNLNELCLTLIKNLIMITESTIQLSENEQDQLTGYLTLMQTMCSSYETIFINSLCFIEEELGVTLVNFLYKSLFSLENIYESQTQTSISMYKASRYKFNSKNIRYKAYSILLQISKLKEDFKKSLGSLLISHHKNFKNFQNFDFETNIRNPSDKYVGLRNYGATCYFNSLLQQLYMINDFKNIINGIKIEEVEDGLNSYHSEKKSSGEVNNLLKRNLVKKLSGKYINLKPDNFFKNLSFSDFNNSNTNLSYSAYLSSSSLTNNQVFQTQILIANLDNTVKQFHSPLHLLESFTKAFNNQPIDPRIQQDCEEFFNMYIDTLEECSKNKNLFEDLFKVKVANEIISMDSFYPYYSERKFPANSISLDIKNKRTLEDAFKMYVKAEILDGDNMFYLENYDKKVPILKRNTIKELSNVVIIHLKRFDFDFINFEKTKLNDYFEFPKVFDFKPYLRSSILIQSKDENYMKDVNIKIKEDELDEDYSYELSGILIHSGSSADAGHYYSFIKSEDDECWYEFDDSKVTKVSEEKVWKESFGDEKDNLGKKASDIDSSHKNYFSRSTNAYMLFYKKKTQWKYKKLNKDNENDNSYKEDEIKDINITKSIENTLTTVETVEIKSINCADSSINNNTIENQNIESQVIEKDANSNSNSAVENTMKKDSINDDKENNYDYISKIKEIIEEENRIFLKYKTYTDLDYYNFLKDFIEMNILGKNKVIEKISTKEKSLSKNNRIEEIVSRRCLSLLEAEGIDYKDPLQFNSIEKIYNELYKEVYKEYLESHDLPLLSIEKPLPTIFNTLIADKHPKKVSLPEHFKNQKLISSTEKGDSAKNINDKNNPAIANSVNKEKNLRSKLIKLAIYYFFEIMVELSDKRRITEYSSFLRNILEQDREQSAWFLKRLIDHPTLFIEYCLESNSVEIRDSFSKIVINSLSSVIKDEEKIINSYYSVLKGTKYIVPKFVDINSIDDYVGSRKASENKSTGDKENIEIQYAFEIKYEPASCFLRFFNKICLKLFDYSRKYWTKYNQFMNIIIEMINFKQPAIVFSCFQDKLYNKLILFIMNNAPGFETSFPKMGNISQPKFSLPISILAELLCCFVTKGSHELKLYCIYNHFQGGVNLIDMPDEYYLIMNKAILANIITKYNNESVKKILHHLSWGVEDKSRELCVLITSILKENFSDSNAIINIINNYRGLIEIQDPFNYKRMNLLFFNGNKNDKDSILNFLISVKDEYPYQTILCLKYFADLSTQYSVLLKYFLEFNFKFMWVYHFLKQYAADQVKYDNLQIDAHNDGLNFNEVFNFVKDYYLDELRVKQVVQNNFSGYYNYSGFNDLV